MAKGSTKELMRRGWTLLWTSIRRFRENQDSLRAGGLTYLTLMALIPGLTFVLVIAGALGVKNELKATLDQLLKDSPPQMIELKDQIIQLVDNVRLEFIGAAGLLVFIYVVMSLLARVEQALNATWLADRGRNLARRYADYIAILFLVPLLVLAATGLKTTLEIAPVVSDLAWLKDVVESGLRILPFVMVWAAATLLYRAMPNVRVRWGPGALAGLIAGGFWIIAQDVFLRVQIHLTRTNAIYGSLALLPVLLLYLYLSWSIVLWGAELCYVVQNRDHLYRPAAARRWTPVTKRRLGLMMMRRAVTSFCDGGVLSLAEFAGDTGWPRSQADEMAQLLCDAGLLHRVRFGQAVVPALPPGRVPLAKIFEAIDGFVEDPPPPGVSEADERVLSELRARVTACEGSI